MDIKMNQLIEKNADLEDKCVELTTQLRYAEDTAQGAKVTDT